MSEQHELQPLDESSIERVLCVAAHPDDLEYGSAAAVDKWVKAGTSVTYLLVTRGEAGIDTIWLAEAYPWWRKHGMEARSSTVVSALIAHAAPPCRTAAQRSQTCPAWVATSGSTRQQRPHFLLSVRVTSILSVWPCVTSI